ncbi:PEP/pyruvate-binding domain-containing protein [Cohnella zeiphila]|uniref:PEP/pyruvate-binding domain-containing protein n=1 Tax=Cohnella zeiphila TaxID=2761120 RepID=A0A7X0VU92_9BACL|nr:PEP/pyruvate-binding domain-containing protein [Cohnella zeiphila]MBB6730027.1 PEP/pyruvate-binding domain-containing protein [Cohnella zeiphila]
MMSIVPLHEADDRFRYGGKAAGLSKAVRAGLPVPAGFAVSCDTVRMIAAEQPQPDALRLLTTRLATLRKPLAVRSSAADEDGAAASYAGLFKTVLNIMEASRVATAIRDVFVSASSESIAAYGAAHRPSVRMAAVVQEMADADISGVLFTRHPVTGEDVRLIEAGWGLGESVVAGRIVPDRCVFPRGDPLAVQAEPGSKETEVRTVSSGGTAEEQVAEDRKKQFCLNADRLRSLDDLASRSERIFGPGGLDIEWAFAGGMLFLLQCRPITV